MAQKQIPGARATSVIIPAFNAGSTLARALRSALEQETPPLEVIVVDDGSTDATELIARAFPEHVRFISQLHAGPAAARNRGVAAARGEYIAFLDADDYWRPGFISACQAFLEAWPAAVAVSVGLQFVSANGRERAGQSHALGLRTSSGEDFLIEDFFSFWAEHNHLCTGSCMMRKDLLQRAGGQRETLRIAEDLEYWAYLATYGTWGYCPKTLWVCDSERASVQAGWLKKHRARRQFCPTVDDWQSRILPRLQARDWPGFARARGRVAAILAHDQILGGQTFKAWETLHQYGDAMPRTWATWLMLAGERGGMPLWRLVCFLLQSRELQKACCKALLKPYYSLLGNGATPHPFELQAPRLNPAPAGEAEVSVIIPAYNSAHCLARAIQSALAQSVPPAEVIVVDDGSSDGTAAVARSFGARIRFCQQVNQGPGAARNAGLEMAQGKLIAFLDADDFWLPGFIEGCTRFLKAHPEAIAVSTGLRFRTVRGTEVVAPAILQALPEGVARPWMLSNFFAFWGAQDHIRTGSCVIRRAVVDKAGRQQPHLRISQDLEYWGYLATFGPWGFIPEVLWVCDSEDMARVGGWMNKYRQRRRLCPSIDDWEERIVPRLQPDDWEGFEKVRGRVAVSFAQSHVLAGRFERARRIVEDYGDQLPSTWLARLLRLGSRFGKCGWLAACYALCLRELQKDIWLRLRGTHRFCPASPARALSARAPVALSPRA